MDDEPVSIVMVGISGYGYYYLKNLLEDFNKEEVRIPGVADPYADKSPLYNEIAQRGIRVYLTLEEFYNEGGQADLVVISSPIHYHVEQTCIALSHGSNVLCEKPMGTVVQDMEKVYKIREESGRWVMIGYQWSYSEAIQALKKDIMSGLFGKPKRLKSLCFWPREKAYYKRNSWAGKIADGEGRWILDSPPGNAMAHFVHNMFYLIGTERDRSIQPVEVIAECYRVYPIENFDTGVFRAFTAEGTEILFYGSHVTENEKNPVFQIEFEEAVITFDDRDKEIIARDRKGREKKYGSPDDDNQFLKLYKAIRTVKNHTTPVCGPEAASSQILCVNGIQESVKQITDIPPALTQSDKHRQRRWIAGIDNLLLDCYGNNVLPHEKEVSWSRPGRNIDLRNYNWFPGGNE
ncbi:MAG: Gfo/Idh/MocA family oxidoreductase [Bacteroidales bacterium]|nr:MAG: Gfo/Idh/MocA family oxidoreductase [Bacteroidales bacterium]